MSRVWADQGSSHADLALRVLVRTVSAITLGGMSGWAETLGRPFVGEARSDGD
jgi:hypothetical protein